MEMSMILNGLRDPAGIPFYPVVFQGLYVLTWALHAAFVFLSLGSFGVSLYGQRKKRASSNWKTLTAHMIQTGKLSVSLLIVLGVAPLLFTQVIYDPNWYVTNTLSGVWVFVFIYALIVGYSMFYWYYYANKKDSALSPYVGVVSFVFLIFAGVLMHVFAYESIQPDKWMQWYAPGGSVDPSGLNFHSNPVRLLFMFSLSIPVTGIFLQAYAKFLSTRQDFENRYIVFVQSLGKKMGLYGLILSALLFVGWMWQASMITDTVVLLTVAAVALTLLMVYMDINPYFTLGFLVVDALLISAVREWMRFDLMRSYGYSIYDYTVNIDWPSVAMFFATFASLGFVGVAFIVTMAWKAGKTQGVVAGDKSKAISLLANATLVILTVWCATYLGWGMFTLFKNTLV